MSSFTIGSISGSRTFNNSVGSTNLVDTYSLNLSASGSLTTSLMGLSADANLRLTNSSGAILKSSSNSGTLAENLIMTGMAAGSYYLQVLQGSGNTNYTLNMTADYAGSGVSSANDLGNLSGSQTRQDYVGSGDATDYYKFNLGQVGSLNLSLNGLSADAHLQLLNSSGGVLQTSNNSGTAAENITMASLAAGTYYVQIYQGSGNTNYSLNLTLGKTYYVSTSGNNTNLGTETQPFKTIQQAATIAKAGDSVIVRGGNYRETVIPVNSGTAIAPITFQAATGETVSIRGTTEIPANSWTRYGASNIWYTAWPGTYTSSSNQSDQVFVDGNMINLARWPQETNANLSRPRQATIDSIVSSTDTGKRAPGPQYPIYRITFTDAEWNQPDNLWDGAKIWVNTGGLDNGALDDVQDGNGQSGTVIDTNLATKQITIEVDASATSGTNTPGNFQLGKGSYYYLFDPLSVNGLLYKGEFWRDRTNNRLYLQTLDASAPGTHTIEVKQRDYAFNLDSKSYITIQGFNIFAASITTDTQAGNGQGNGGNREGTIAPSHHITLDGLKAKYVSHFTDQTGNIQTQWTQSSGIILSGSNHIIRNSEIAWSAGSGLVVIGQSNKVLNNVIHDTNYTATEGGAISLGRTTNIISLDHEIGYNTIYNTGIDGIDFSALRNSSGSKATIKARIHHNTIYDTVLQSADSGAIKAYGSDGGWVRIDHNTIYNTGGANLTDKYIYYGIYLDYPKLNGGYVIDHNVIYNTPTGMNINGMKNVEIYNNTILARPEVARAAITANGTLSNVTIRNLLSNRGLRLNTSGVTLSNNIWDATETITWFVDATNLTLSKRNYRLVSGAIRAINQGYNVGQFNDAIPPDIGAYEF